MKTLTQTRPDRPFQEFLGEDADGVAAMTLFNALEACYETGDDETGGDTENDSTADVDTATIYDDIDPALLLDAMNKQVASIIADGMKEHGIETYRELQGKIKLSQEAHSYKPKGRTREIDFNKPAPRSTFLDGVTNPVWERYSIHATRLLELSDAQLRNLLRQRDKDNRASQIREHLDRCQAKKKAADSRLGGCGDNHWTTIEGAVSAIGKAWDEFSHDRSEYKKPLEAIRRYLRGQAITAGYCVWKHDSPYDAGVCAERPACRGFHYRHSSEARFVSVGLRIKDLRKRQRTIMGTTFSEDALLTYGALLEREHKHQSRPHRVRNTAGGTKQELTSTALDEHGQLSISDLSEPFKAFLKSVEGSSALLGLTEPELLSEETDGDDDADGHARGDWAAVIANTIKEVRDLHRVPNGHIERIEELELQREQTKEYIYRSFTRNQLTDGSETKQLGKRSWKRDDTAAALAAIDLDAPLADEDDEVLIGLNGRPLTHRVVLKHFKEAVYNGEIDGLNRVYGNPVLVIRKPEYVRFKGTFLDDLEDQKQQTRTAEDVQARLEAEARKESARYKKRQAKPKS